MHHAGAERKKAGRPQRGGVSGGEIEPLDWDALYKLARAIDLSPSEFWDMTLPEFLLEVDMKTPDGNETGKFAGRLTSSDIDDLLGFMDEGTI